MCVALHGRQEAFGWDVEAPDVKVGEHHQARALQGRGKSGDDQAQVGGADPPADPSRERAGYDDDGDDRGGEDEPDHGRFTPGPIRRPSFTFRRPIR